MSVLILEFELATLHATVITVRSISTTRSCPPVTPSFQAILLQFATLCSNLRVTFSAILFSYKPMGIEKIRFFFSS